MKHLEKGFIIICGLILVIPIAFINLKTNQVSEIDNRMLQEIPIYGKELDYTNAWENYFSDRIGLRNTFIKMYNIYNDKLFHYMSHPVYTYGEDGYVFFKLSREEENDGFTETFAKLIREMQTYCEEREITFLYSLNPSKTTTYREYLQKGINLNNERSNKLVSLLKEEEINFVNNIETLETAKKREQVFNVKYDAGHWNDTGAFIGINRMMQELQKSFPSIELKEKEDFSFQKLEYDTLPVSYFPIKDTTLNYSLKDIQFEQDTSYDKEIEISESFPTFLRYTNNKGNKPKILVFRGSYFNGREKFFVDQFSEATLVHNYVNAIDMEYYINIFQPDIVLFESAEYATNSNYFPIELMDKKVYNKSYDYYKSNKQERFVDYQLESSKKGQALTKIKIKVDNADKVSSIYLKTGSHVLDFKKSKDELEGFEVTLDNNMENKDMKIIFISNDERKQQICSIKI